MDERHGLDGHLFAGLVECATCGHEYREHDVRDGCNYNLGPVDDLRCGCAAFVDPSEAARPTQ